MNNEPNGEGTPSEPEKPDGKKDSQLPADPSDASQDKPNRELKKQTPEEERRERFHWIAASQFAYTLVGATLLLGWLGHWLGNKLGGEPWNLILMLLFGGTGFVIEMWRMIRMFTPKDDKKNGKDSNKDQKGGKDNDKKS